MADKQVLMTIDINTVYEQLSKIDVPLERQHTYNRNYIDQKMIECDHARDLLDKLNTKVTHELTNLEINHSILEEEFNNKKRNELANNTELAKKYVTGKERESAAELILSDSLTEMNKVSRKLLALKNLAGVIKTKQSIMNSKLRNLQDQFRMMCEYLKVNVPSPDDKTIEGFARTLGELDKLAAASSFNSDDVEEAEETIEQDTAEEISTPGDSQPSGEHDTTDVDIAIDLSDTVSSPSPVTQQASNDSPSEDVDTSDLGLSNNDSSVSDKTEQIADPDQEEESSEEEASILDMDTILDGLDAVPGEELEISGDSDSSSNEGGEGTTLEDVISNKGAVVTDEPANKTAGQREPTLKEKTPTKTTQTSTKSTPEKTSGPPKTTGKKVLKEDAATTAGEVDIDSILDELSGP
jgi:hypothetical protein